MYGGLHGRAHSGHAPSGLRGLPDRDGVGGISPTAHEAALRRVEPAGARPVTAIAFVFAFAFATEIMRDWTRSDSNWLRELSAGTFQRRPSWAGAKGSPEQRFPTNRFTAARRRRRSDSRLVPAGRTESNPGIAPHL